MTKAALWIRVSKDEQHPENQEAQLRAWAERLQLDISAVYRLPGFSASRGEQEPVLRKMLDDAAFGDFSLLLVTSLDRLERRGIGQMHTLIQRIAHAGVSLRSLNEPWVDTTGPTRDLFIAIFAWLAEQESRKISERTKAGIARRKAEGLPVGRPEGAKDLGKRKRSGYLARYERERAK